VPSSFKLPVAQGTRVTRLYLFSQSTSVAGSGGHNDDQRFVFMVTTTNLLARKHGDYHETLARQLYVGSARQLALSEAFTDNNMALKVEICGRGRD
jgi:hypothetical protein